MTMTAATPPRILSISLLLHIILHFHPHYPILLITASRDVSSNLPVTSSYQPSSSVEGKWIAEEEFHGASSLSTDTESQLQRRLKRKKKQKYDPIPGHERLEDPPSWWDEEEEGSGFDVVDEDDDEQLMTKTTTPQISTSNKDNATLPRRKGLRMRIWKRSNRQMRNEASPSKSSSLGKNHPAEESNHQLQSLSTSSEYDEEHPMRTDEWLLNIRLSRLYSIEEGEYFPECNNLARYTSANTALAPKKGGGSRTKRQVMQFARNGYVKIIEDDDKIGIKRKCKPRVGKWRIGHSGVAFDIPMQMQVANKGVVGRKQHQLLPAAQVSGSDNCIEDNSQSRVATTTTTTTTTVLHYHADIHLNKFGERPRMFRGVITRDRHSSFLPPNFLRPVIGTFSAEGIGHDTADTSYRDRAISLSRQQVINEAKGLR